jgi:predicted DNA-binding ribbon-helix-helix protein
MPGQIKTSVTLAGHRTSITLEKPFLDSLKDIAIEQKISLNDLVTQIDKSRLATTPPTGLSSAIRLFVLEHYKNKSYS